MPDEGKTMNIIWQNQLQVAYVTYREFEALVDETNAQTTSNRDACCFSQLVLRI